MITEGGMEGRGDGREGEGRAYTNWVGADLKEEDGAGEEVGVVRGRAGLVNGLVLGPPADERVEVAAFKLVGVAGEKGEVGDTVERAACLQRAHTHAKQ